jgi:hypothetical protein
MPMPPHLNPPRPFQFAVQQELVRLKMELNRMAQAMATVAVDDHTAAAQLVADREELERQFAVLTTYNIVITPENK